MKIKSFILTGALLLVLGLAAFAVAMTNLGWNFSKLSANNYENASFRPENDVNTVLINTEYADVTLKKGDELSVEYQLNNSTTYSFGDGNGILTVTQKYKKIGFLNLFGKPASVTVTLPSDMDSITVRLDMGSFDAGGVGADKIEAVVACGDCSLSDLTAGSVKINSSAGKVGLKGVTVNETATVKSSMGDVTAEYSTIREFHIDSDCGEVKIDCLSCETAEISCALGDAEVSGSEISTLTVTVNCGTITAKYCKISDLLSCKSGLGDIKLKNVDCGYLETVADCGDVKLEEVTYDRYQ